jgi:hypothetical protein
MKTESQAGPHHTVREMAAEAKSGRTHPLLRQFLQEKFPRQAQGWLSRWLSGPPTYEVHGIVLFEDGRFFRRSCLFDLHARDRLLECAVLPSGGTCGLFSLDDDGLRYFNHRQDNLEELLRREGRPLDACAPMVLARLVAEALGREGNASHDVLASAQQLAKYDGGLNAFGGAYEIDLREWERVQPSVAAPALASDRGSGWRLEFCSVFGWMHEKQRLIRHRVRFAPDYRIEHEQEALSRKIFDRTPSLRY